MLTTADIQFLLTPLGTELLREASALPGNIVQKVDRLRKKYPREQVAAALEMVDLRQRGRAKFTDSDKMWFTPQGLEQSSGETIAQWRSLRFPKDGHIVDLCCGIGGDSIQLGKDHHVTAVDIDPATALCAQSNFIVFGSDAHAICADATKLNISADFGFFDPSRRSGGRTVRHGDQYSPPLSFVNAVSSKVSGMAVKVSPGLPDEEMEQFNASVEFVSVKGECKEAIIWTGALSRPFAKSATLLPSEITLANSNLPLSIGVTPPMGYLYEPDPAVIRAHLVQDVAEIVHGSLMDEMIAYITSDAFISTPFATAYRVIEWMPFHTKNLQKRLRQMERRVVAIKKRGVPMDPLDLRDKLTGFGDSEAIIVLTRYNDSPIAIICELV